MDIERLLEEVAALDHITYSYFHNGIFIHDETDVVYATIKEDTVVIAGKRSAIEIDVDRISCVKVKKDYAVINFGDDEAITIIYSSPGDNF